MAFTEHTYNPETARSLNVILAIVAVAALAYAVYEHITYSRPASQSPSYHTSNEGGIMTLAAAGGAGGAAGAGGSAGAGAGVGSGSAAAPASGGVNAAGAGGVNAGGSGGVNAPGSGSINASGSAPTPNTVNNANGVGTVGSGTNNSANTMNGTMPPQDNVAPMSPSEGGPGSGATTGNTGTPAQ